MNLCETIAYKTFAPYWEKLEPLYVPDSDSWRIALNQAANNVGFSNKSNSFAFFLRDLVGKVMKFPRTTY
jgi:hypothetical protein